jgi:hypothetical protein
MSCDNLDILEAVNRSQIDQLKNAGLELDPAVDRARFSKHVSNVQAMVVHTYQLIAWQAVRQPDPKEAARFWKAMTELCDAALTVLKEYKSVYPHCGTPELYDLTLDYRNEAQKRYIQNVEDAECAKIPPGLFPQ